MANRDIVTRAGKAAPLSATDHDQNMNSLSGTVERQTGATYTVVYTDQGKTIELDNASMVVTLDAIATIAAAGDTDNFTITLKNINAATATIQRSGTDTINGVTSKTIEDFESITLQTDSTGTMWSIIPSRVTTEATLITPIITDPTVTDPVINGVITGTALGRGALAYHSTTQSIPNNTRTIKSFNSEDYDTETIHDNVTNNSRLTVPTGVTKVKLKSMISMAGGTGYYEARIIKNGVITYAGAGRDDNQVVSAVAVKLNLETPTITVVATDYFEVDLLQNTGGSIVSGGGSDTAWFNMEIIK